ncbi:response regulator [Inconstantimicrobium mannanitabidum]|uniref:DNA-binding response regulator n=1 Tax=Inconstantimicrobium mannanitabidum TaxID=1604901 RepID=A0ACB5RDQ5_9CLOT|nr:response regulator [Clostridium sp. TW13]GKX67235.1 DNA-binding response regulator [Clostridium sp. TW13]
MYKILIVDDEAIIRKGLKTIVDWDKLQCNVCGEACDGIEAIEMVKTYMPDMIIIDIRMPGMNGIDAIKYIKDIDKKCKIIILSGYRDFEYMQSAIKLGAFDYILKPSKVVDIVNVVQRAINQIEEEKKKENEVDTLRKNAEDSTVALRQKLLYDLLLNATSQTGSIADELKLCNLNIENYRVVAIEISNLDNECTSFRLQGISDLFYDTFKKHCDVFSVKISYNKFVYIISSSDKDILMQETEGKLNELIKSINEYYNFKISAGISDHGQDLFRLSVYFKQAVKYLGPKSEYNQCLDINKDEISEKRETPDKAIFMPLVIKNTVDYLNKNYKNNITLNEMAEYNNISSFYLSRLFAKETGKNFVDYLNEIRIEKAKALLKENNYKYYEIADMVGIKDAHYFSKIFKKYTGLTPSDYKNTYVQ